jgi:hypothetical protein
MAPTVITAGLAKPSNASLGVRMPETINTVMTPMAVRSTGIVSVTNKKIVIRRMRETIQMLIISHTSRKGYLLLQKQ